MDLLEEWHVREDAQQNLPRRALVQQGLREGTAKLRGAAQEVRRSTARGGFDQDAPMVGAADLFGDVLLHGRVSPEGVHLRRFFDRQAQGSEGDDGDADCAEGRSSRGTQAHLRQDHDARLGACRSAYGAACYAERGEGLHRVAGPQVVAAWARDLVPIVGFPGRPEVHANLLDQSTGHLQDPLLRSHKDLIDPRLQLVLDPWQEPFQDGVVVVVLHSVELQSLDLLRDLAAMFFQHRALQDVNLHPDLPVQLVRRVLGAKLQLANIVVTGRQLALRAILQARELTQDIGGDVHAMARLAAHDELLLLDHDEGLLHVRADVLEPRHRLPTTKVLGRHVDPPLRGLLRVQDLGGVAEDPRGRVHGADLLAELRHDLLRRVLATEPTLELLGAHNEGVVAREHPEGPAVGLLHEVSCGLWQRATLGQRADHAGDVRVVL
mmetsp:Transcript_49567/g.142102  ORF Transcript_49567/g.142102 Transcript_49567/m.142102 type:complete len:437 (-) Transcript_49567:140-1450(-)